MPNEFRVRNGLIVDAGGAQVTGSLSVIVSSNVELQVTSAGVKLGNVITDAHVVTGSLGISGSLTTQDAVTINNQSGGTPAAGTTPGTPTNAYGIDGTNYLGTPTVWLKIRVDGADYYFPGYE